MKEKNIEMWGYILHTNIYNICPITKRDVWGNLWRNVKDGVKGCYNGCL